MPRVRESLTDDAPATNYGEGFRITLACPQCGTQAWVEWQRLTRGLRCPKCRCQFLIGPQGKLLAQEDLPQTHYRCPRCGRSGSVPTMLSVRGAECLDCKLPLAPGPDQRLHGRQEAAALHRRAAREAKSPRVGVPASLAAARQRMGKFGFAAAAAGALALLLGLTFFAIGGLRSGADADATRFTHCLLAGDWDGAQRYVPDDEVERAEFERWRRRYFTSIVEKFRPKGDRVTVAVATLSESPDQRSLELEMASPFLGKRSHRQEWRLTEAGWRFSPVATLALP